MNMIFLIFYEVILWLIALIALPKTIFSFFYHKKYRESLLPRLGFGYPIFPKNGHSSIWIHAVSVGETKAIVPLARELNRLFPDNPLIISSASETGHMEAKRSLPFADHFVYLPLDFTCVINPIVKNASPGLVILCESDFWYNFLFQCKKRGAAIALVSGKMSERSSWRFGCVPFFSKKLFGLLDILCVQNSLYYSRFIKAGSFSEKMKVTGNLKLDEDYPQLSNAEIIEWRQKLGIQVGQPVLTIGSSHDSEEQLFLKILKDLWKESPHLRVILVPRRPERFKEVGRLLEKEGLKWINFTEINQRVGNEQVILIDAMGLLRMCYQLADFALVGGSFTDRVGGHNILEPCWYGKPVLFGPHMQTQLELVELIKQYGAGLQVDQKGLEETLRTWLKHPDQAKEIGSKGWGLINDFKGSTSRTLEAIHPFLDKIRENSEDRLVLK